MRHINGLVVIALFLATAGCQGMSGRREGQVNHLVICWLKQPGDEKSRQELIDASKSFEKTIPGVVRVTAGYPLPSTRPVVDSSYDVGIVMIFRDEAALRVFEHHPAHMEAVDKTLKPLVQRFVVYDFVENGNR